MRQRLDFVLVNRGIAKSRSRAHDLIARGAVSVEGRLATKAGQLVEPDVELVVDGEANAFVARSGAKLVAGLEGFKLSANGRIALDLGASTGGFTQVLLESGASRVYAVDVGHGQLDADLAADARVVSLEGRDARRLTEHDIREAVSAIVVDVSFISVLQVLPAGLSFAASGCWLVALVKPQFEIGRKGIGKGGIVRDENARIGAVSGVQDFLIDNGWRVLGLLPSPLPGKKGNEEYLVGAILDE